MLRRRAKRSLNAVLIGFCLASPLAAHATIVNISATTSGENLGSVGVCFSNCNGSLISPNQVTLAAGTHVVSDAVGQPGALYDAWNWQVGNSQSWVWEWKALKDDGSHGSTIAPANYASYFVAQANVSNNANTPLSPSFTTEAAAAAAGTALSPVTFTLATSTTLDFVINDNGLYDNAGGVSLNIQQVGAPGPTPGEGWLSLIGVSILMMIAARYRGLIL